MARGSWLLCPSDNLWALPCFLAQEDLVLSCPSFGISHPSRRALLHFSGEWHLEAKIWVLGMLRAKECMNVYVGVHVYVHKYTTYICYTYIHTTKFIPLSIYILKCMHLTNTSYFRVQSNFLPFHICNSILQQWEPWLPLSLIYLLIWSTCLYVTISHLGYPARLTLLRLWLSVLGCAGSITVLW